MEKRVFFLVLAIFIIASQVVLGQTRQEKRFLKALDSQISEVESELKDLRKEFEMEKKKSIYELKKELERTKLIAYQKVRVTSNDEIERAIKKVSVLEEKIADIESWATNSLIDVKDEDLEKLKEMRNEALLIATKKDMPKEMSYCEMKRRKRSNEVRREDLVLEVIETNFQPIAATPDKGVGLEVIFHNEFSQRTTFIVRGINGGQRTAISLAPRSWEVYYFIEGRYMVESIVSGRKSPYQHLLVIDGQKHLYQLDELNEPLTCFGIVHKARY